MIKNKSSRRKMTTSEPPLLYALIAGGAAGTVVDVTLFPLDTLKTRLQSAKGFMRSGGFRGIYSGLGPAVIGSAPNAAVFFLTYEFIKKMGKHSLPDSLNSVKHMIAATCGEIMACTVRVPIEVVKQRSQASPATGSLFVLRTTLKQEGFKGLYRGFNSTIIREVPFSLVQFPIWEYLKAVWSRHRGRYIESWQASLCGAFAGGIAAFVTTPLDVVKTRVMLAEKGSIIAKGNVLPVLQAVWLEKGIKGLYAGVVPRVIWISLGGAVFLGVYEKTKHFLMDHTNRK